MTGVVSAAAPPLLGAALGAGLWLLLLAVPRRPALTDRVVPYLLAVSPAARARFRSRGGLRAAESLAPVPMLIAAVASAAALAPRVLARRARARRARTITDELPDLIEFLALALAAGENVLSALRRVAGVGTGELCGELSRCLRDVDAGVPVADALDAMAAALDVPALRRLVEQLQQALEQGSPLAEVLRNQAEDARAERKRHLLELAGRKEVAMLVPLVFLILPLTVLFAVWPGLLMLQLAV